MNKSQVTHCINPMHRKVLAALTTVLLTASTLSSQTTTDEDDVVVLSPFSVHAERDRSGYGVTSLTSVTRLNTPLREVPQTVNIATEQLIKELAAPTLGEAVAFLPGVTTRGGGQDQFQVRSIDVFSQFRNSFRYTTGSSLHYQKDLTNIDRVEVIKGLGSATTGRGEAGGVVNLITKKPQTIQASSIKALVASWGYFKTELDTTGPVNDSGSILYRMIAAYTGGEIYLPNEKYDTISLYPSIEFRISDRTNLLIEGSLQSGRTPSAEFFEIQDEFQFFSRAPDGTIVRTFPQDGALHKTRMLPLSTPQTASWVEPDAQAYDVLAVLNHKFTDWLSTRQGVLWFKAEIDRELTRLRGFGSYVFSPDDPDGFPIDWTMALRHDLREQDTEFLSYQGDFLFDYSFAGMNHQTLAGYEFRNRDFSHRFSRANTGGIFRILENTEFLNLQRSDLPPQSVSTHETRDIKETSYYLQHSTKLFKDRFQVLGGWRYDKIEEDIFNHRNNTLTQSRPKATDATFRIGASYKITPWISAFVVHAEQQDPVLNVLRYPDGTFGVPGRDPNERVSASRTVELDEIGLKSELLDGKFTVNISYYKILEGSDIRTVNFRTNRNDELDPLYNWRESVVDPAATAEGVEIEVMGAPTDRLSFYASAAFAHTAISAVQSDQSVIKRRQRGDTPVRLNFVGNYLAFRNSQWAWYVQNAFGYVDDVVLNPDNIVLQSSSFRWDIGVRVIRGVGRGSWEAQARVQNILDQRITTGTANSGTAPRRFSFYLERRF